MKIKLDTYMDNEVMDVDEEHREVIHCDKCSHMFPLCMIENTEFLCGKRVSEVMQRIFTEQ